MSCSIFFCFKQKTAYEMRISDWSSDVCSSDLTVIVTGGGSGIGRCTAHELASLGAHVVITGRKAEKLDTTAAEIREDGGSVSSLIFDIRDEDAVKQAVKSVIAARGRIAGLVNNRSTERRGGEKGVGTR